MKSKQDKFPGYDVLKQMHHDQEMSLSDIAKHFKVGKSTVTNWLTRAGIEIKRRVVPFNIDRDALYDLYVNQKLAARTIAKQYGVAISTIMKQLEHHNIPMRKGADRNVIKSDLAHRDSNAYSKLSSRSWLRDQYVRKMRSIQDIGKELGDKHYQTVAPYIKKFNLDNIRARYRSFVLHVVCKQYTTNQDISYYEITKRIPWIRPEHIKSKLIELGLEPKKTNSYPKRKYNKSGLETNIVDFISQFRDNVQDNFFLEDNGINRRRSVDIYLPDDKLCIEVNGLYYHSEHNGFDRNAHLLKQNNAREMGLDLIYLWEDDIKLKTEIVQSMLMNRLNVIDRRLYARKTEIVELNSRDKNDFLDSNHLQGRCNSTIAYGLVHNGELVACMSFLYDQRKDMYELNRFCNLINHTVVGGFSKLLKQFLSDYPDKDIISYSHNDWSCGDVYKNNGFEMSHINPPSYSYYNNRIYPHQREHRSKYQKNKIVKKYNLPVDYANIYTETELIDMVNSMTTSPTIYKIYDCGTTTWVYKKKGGD